MIPEFQTAAELRAHYKLRGIGVRNKMRPVMLPQNITLPAPTISTSKDVYYRPDVAAARAEKQERFKALEKQLRDAKSAELADKIKFSTARIIAVVCNHLSLGVADVKSRSRKPAHVEARRLIYCLVYKHTFSSLPQMGLALRRDHSTVLYGVVTGFQNAETLTQIKECEAILGFPADGLRKPENIEEPEQ